MRFQVSVFLFGFALCLEVSELYAATSLMKDSFGGASTQGDPAWPITKRLPVHATSETGNKTAIMHRRNAIFFEIELRPGRRAHLFIIELWPWRGAHV